MMPPARQTGLTLVELMVSIALGLAVVLAATSLLLSSRGAYSSQLDATRLQDGGRYALELLSRTVRQAGYRDLDGAAAEPQAAAIAGLDAMSLARTAPGLEQALPQQINGSDVLAVRFSGGVGHDNETDGAMINCAGLAVPADTADVRGWSIFYVARDAAGAAELRCKYHGREDWTSDAIARGVESFQVLYGLDLDRDAVPEQFVNATAIERLDAGLVSTGANAAAQDISRQRQSHWHRVASVRIGLMVHGSDAPRGDVQPVQHDLFGAAYGDAHGADDTGTRIDESALPAASRHRLRKVFSVTVPLRNRAGGAA